MATPAVPPATPPDTSQTADNTQCVNENQGEGCSLAFPAKTAAGLCQRCIFLNSLDPTTAEYQKALCMTCGVSWQRLPYTNECGKCHQKALAEAGVINHGLDVARHARGQAFNIHSNRQPKPNALAATPPQPTVDLNTAALDQFRNVGYNDADCVKVYAKACLDTNSKVNMRLGQTSRSYPPDTFMDEIMDELLAGWNVTWTKTKMYPLAKETSEWRFHGNQIIQDSQHMAVLDFYQAHKMSGAQDAYFSKLPKHAASMKGRVLAPELWIDTPQEDTSPTPGTSIRKRKNSTKTSKENDDPTKRPRISGAVGSVFQRKAPRPDPTKSTEINLSFADIVVDKGTCAVEVRWPADSTSTALISDEISFSGKMKHCYKLSIGEEQYVAKQFFEIGTGKDEITIAQNTTNLELEVVRCEQARWFLNEFRATVDSHNIATATSWVISELMTVRITEPSIKFEITRCRLAQEVVKSDGAPSPASGVVAETGTMEHPAGMGQMAHTLSAFVHYAFQWSEGEVIFADIQGSPGRLSTNTMGIIIFDLMTHTPDGDSGVGDFGNLELEIGNDDEEDT
ncbi:hypothetical protein C8J57DRAFT_1500831 [Mycena rebaudengoi]|nr:hypothetical protein C8J57DRAFT_1500831 [Mycena rebaudengoi]